MIYIISLLIVIFMALPLAFVLDITWSRSVVIIVGLSMIGGYIGGVLGNILWGQIPILCMFVATGIISIYKEKNELKILKDKGILFIVIVFFLQAFYHKYSVINNWDDWSHWAVQAKNIYYSSRFPCEDGNSISLFLDYFPGIQIWEAIWMRLSNSFSDMGIYISLNMAVYFFFAAIIQDYKNRWSTLCGLVLFFSVNLFAPWTFYSVTMDLFLAVLFGYSLYLVYTRKYCLLEITICVAMMCLSKQTGSIFALIICALLFSQYFIYKERKQLAIVFLEVLTIAFIDLTWTMVKQKNNVVNTGQDVYSNIMKRGVGYFAELPKWHIQGFKNFWISIINPNIIDNTSQNTFLMVGNVKLPEIVYIVLVFMLLFYISNRQRERVLDYVLVLGTLGYFIFISSLYLLNFSIGEVEILSSDNRYIGTFLMAIYVLDIGMLFNKLNNISHKLTYRDHLCIVGFVIFLSILPYNSKENFYYGLFDNRIMEDRKTKYLCSSRKCEQAKKIMGEFDEQGTIVIDNADIVTVAQWNYYFYPYSVRLWGSSSQLYDSDKYIIIDWMYSSESEIRNNINIKGKLKDGAVYKIRRTNTQVEGILIDDSTWEPISY